MAKIKTTVRRGIGVAPPHMVCGISDYSAQELRVIACIAKVQAMVDAFFAEKNNPILYKEDGTPYDNPASDLHCSAALAMYSELERVPLWDLVKEAKKDCGGWNRRQRGKICNFT